MPWEGYLLAVFAAVYAAAGAVLAHRGDVWTAPAMGVGTAIAAGGAVAIWRRANRERVRGSRRDISRPPPLALATEHDPDAYLGIEGIDGPPPTRGWYVLTKCGRVCGVGYFDGATVRSVDPLGAHCGPASDFIRHAPLVMGVEREVRHG